MKSHYFLHMINSLIKSHYLKTHDKFINKITFFELSATVPCGTQWSVYDPLGWFCGPEPGPGSGTGFLSLKGSQGFASGFYRVTLFHVFFWIVFQPSKIHLWSPLGVKLVPKWPPTSEPVWVLGGIKKRSCVKKPKTQIHSLFTTLQACRPL